jgi:hypothetical protein
MEGWVRHPRNSVRWWLPRVSLLLGSVAALAVVVGSVLIFPRWLVQWELGDKSDTLDSPDLAQAINDVRTTLFQGIAGVAVLGTGIVAYRQLRVAQGGQITERLNKAIDHLSKGDEHVRLGGIYALERIANDSRDDREAIAEILTAYVRQHAKWKKPSWSWPPRQAASTEVLEGLRVRQPDVQAAMTVLGRRKMPPGGAEPLLLFDVDLRQAGLRGGDLSKADLRGAHLEGADLHSAHLEEADLRRAYLGLAKLQGGKLKAVDLCGAHLQGAKLQGAKLEGAHADSTTIWCDGLPSETTEFDWKAAGVTLIRVEANAPGAAVDDQTKC